MFPNQQQAGTISPGLNRNVKGREMQKQQRDRVFSSLTEDENTIYRNLIREVRSERKSSSSSQFTAREVLEPRKGGLSAGVQEALDAVIARDEMGPMAGEQPPDFDLKLMGTEERVRLSSFKGNRAVGLIFGSYT